MLQAKKMALPLLSSIASTSGPVYGMNRPPATIFGHPKTYILTEKRNRRKIPLSSRPLLLLLTNGCWHAKKWGKMGAKNYANFLGVKNADAQEADDARPWAELNKFQFDECVSFDILPGEERGEKEEDAALGGGSALPPSPPPPRGAASCTRM